MLIQERDYATEVCADMKVVTKRQPSAEEWEQLMLAWKVVNM